jgi:hypothetical protein
MTFKKAPPDLFLYVMFVTIVCRHDESNHLRRKWEVGWDSYLASAKVAIFDLVSGIMVISYHSVATWPVLR